MTHPATTSAGKAGQILSLNGVRGLAALMVVLSHLHDFNLYAGPVHEGSLGVMVFFTLSGFLMGLLYLGQPASWYDVARYAVARFSRIAPPYLIVVVGGFLIYTLVDPQFPYKIGPDNLLRHLLFSGNVSVFWSIPPEVQFYALFIVLWWAVQRALQGRTSMLIGVAALSVVAMCVRDAVPGTVVISKLHYFLLGAMLGGLHPWLRRVPISTAALTVLQVGLLATLGLFLMEVIHLPKNYWHELTPALVTGLAVFAFSHDRTAIDTLFSTRPFQWLGDWSFSVYLMHVPFIYLFSKFGLMQPGLLAWVSVAAAVAGCAVFSIVVEHPACAFTRRGLGALLQRLAPGHHSRQARQPAPEAGSASGLLVRDITPDNTSR